MAVCRFTPDCKVRSVHSSGFLTERTLTSASAVPNCGDRQDRNEKGRIKDKKRREIYLT